MENAERVKSIYYSTVNEKKKIDFIIDPNVITGV